MVTADLSFISLALVLPALVRCSAPEATFVLLVKPQFESGRGQAPRGVVHDPTVWRSTLETVATASTELGLNVLGFMASPLRGPAGNVEFLMHAVRPPDAAPAATPGSARDRAERIAGAVRQAEAISSSSHA
jgi:23S rRNA (cytidine1920-2'-O)/16S rRNA (cytidine1409-2'-O)-methyltransferase